MVPLVIYMRKFIISDIHGNGDIYDSIMGYLENISLNEDVELYINGDLIDRGIDSYRVLEDIVKRIHENGRIRIHYLGGNHELMMYQALKKRKKGKALSHWSNWMLNGGWVIEGVLDEKKNYEELCDGYRDFLADLKLYHVFDEKISNCPLILVHSQAPKDFVPMKIGDNNYSVFRAVWTRKKDDFGLPHRIGKKGYFTIIGHTPVLNKNGFYYDSSENALDIDGGCAGFAIGQFQYSKVPLVEVKDDHLEILVFNHDNEILKGFYFDGEFHPMNEEELNLRRGPINHQFDGQEEVYKEKTLEMVRASKGLG